MKLQGADLADNFLHNSGKKTMKTKGLLSAAMFFAIALLSACGGGGGDGSPLPSAAGGTSGSGGSASSLPSDFQLIYVAKGIGIYGIPADTLMSPTQLVAGNISYSVQFFQSDVTATTIGNGRPRLVVYYLGGQWWKLDLRSGNSAVPMVVANDSVGPCGTGFARFTDTSNFNHSYLFVPTAPTTDCQPAQIYYRAIRLDDTASTATRSIPTAPILPLTNDAGAITGFAVGLDTELRIYDADLATYKTPLQKLKARPRFAANFSSSGGKAYVSVQDANSTALIYAINGDGSLDSPLCSIPNTQLVNGVADKDAIFINAIATTSDRKESIYRVPFDASATATALTSLQQSGLAVLGLTDQKAIVRAAGTTSTLYALPKTGSGDAVTLTSVSGNFINAPIFFSADRVYWSANEMSSNGTTTDLRAGITTDQGVVIQQFPHSTFLSSSYSPRIATRGAGSGQPYPDGAILVRGYTGTFATDGELGGTLSFYDLAADTIKDVYPVTDRVWLHDDSTQHFALAGLETVGSSAYCTICYRTDGVDEILAYEFGTDRLYRSNIPSGVKKLLPL